MIYSLVSIYFDSPQLGIQKKTNFIKHYKTIDPEIFSEIFFYPDNFLERGLGLLHHILCIIFQEKCFSCYILLTDKILLSDCLYFSRY